MVAEVLDYATDAKQYLGQGLDVHWQLKVCRRLVQLSCPYQGVRPPTVLDVVQASAKGDLGPRNGNGASTPQYGEPQGQVAGTNIQYDPTHLVKKPKRYPQY